MGKHKFVFYGFRLRRKKETKRRNGAIERYLTLVRRPISRVTSKICRDSVKDMMKRERERERNIHRYTDIYIYITLMT